MLPYHFLITRDGVLLQLFQVEVSMSWIGKNLLPAVATVIRQHHGPPRLPTDPKQLAAWLRWNGDTAESEFVARIAPGFGFDTLIKLALSMLAQEEE